MAGSRVIVAMDVTDRESAVRIARAVTDEIFAIKVNWPIILGCGPDIVAELGDYGKVICDLKIADIPNTVRLIIEQITRQKPWGVITHAFPGADSLEAAVRTNPSLKVFSIVAMSNPGSVQMVDQHFEEMVRISVDAGVYGFVGPGNKPELLAQIRELAAGKTIITPGIGAQGGNPADAIKAGSDYVIVGRHIYNAADPLAAVKNINSEIARIL